MICESLPSTCANTNARIHIFKLSEVIQPRARVIALTYIVPAQMARPRLSLCVRRFMCYEFDNDRW